MMVRMPLTPSRSFVAPQFLATCRCGTFNRRSRDGFGPKSCRVKNHVSLPHPWVYGSYPRVMSKDGPGKVEKIHCSADVLSAAQCLCAKSRAFPAEGVILTL